MLRLLLRWWDKQDDAVREFLGCVHRALRNFAQSGTRHAAALAYYAIFSIFPLTLLLAVIVGRILGPVAAQEQIASALSLFMPGDTVLLVQSNIAQATEQSGSFTLVAVVGLLWSGLGLFSNITFSLDVIFDVPARHSLWRQRLVAAIMALVLIVLVTASFLTSAVLRLVSASLLGQPSAWLEIGTIFLPLGLEIVIFALLFRFVPTRRVHWDAVWSAAVFGAAGWELAKAGFAWYTAQVSNFQFIYSGIATVIALLLWMYLIAGIFILSAELCAQLNEWLWAQDERALRVEGEVIEGHLSDEE
jgi:membrane protein